MSWIAALDTRSARWPRVVRWSYLSLKWTLVCVGAAGLIYNAALKYGAPVAVWLAIWPIVYGFYQGFTAWRSQEPSQPPPR
jgi:hypothetical protein